MSDPLISANEIEEYISCPPLISRKEHDSDEDEHDDAVAKRNTEDEETERIMSELSSPRGYDNDTPLEDMLADRNMEDEEHATDEEADETEPI